MNSIQLNSFKLLTAFHIFILASANTTCEPQNHDQNNNHGEALRYKLAAIASILLSSALGICTPLLLKNLPALQPDKPIRFLVKAFAAGVILATGFIHILPDAFHSLTNSCLGGKSWGSFPFAGFIAMVAAIGTLMMESFASGYHRRAELRKAQPVNGDEDEEMSELGIEGHFHGGSSIVVERSNSSDLIRHRVISQVLELGIVVHSVIIGISLGATQSPKTIRPLIAALSFHQFFEGMGLGGCISQAKFKPRTITTMVLFFSLTTPTGIAVGILISKIYNDNSPTALAVEGALNSASAGILIYMALVDLLAADFMNPKLQNNFRIQLGASVTLLLGACCMSLLAIWGGT